MTVTTRTQHKQVNWWKRFVRLQNPLMKWLLNSPLHVFVSHYYMLLMVTGRKSGQVYTIPVQYKKTNSNELFVVSNRNYVWWKNLQDGARVALHINGENRQADADVSLQPQVVRRAVETMYPSLNPQQKDKLVETCVVILLTA